MGCGGLGGGEGQWGGFVSSALFPSEGWVVTSVERVHTAGVGQPIPNDSPLLPKIRHLPPACSSKC